MLDNDYDIIYESLKTINTRHSFEKEEENPYHNPHRAQKKCTHMWSNDTDAIYYTAHGKRKCAICGKEF